MATVVAEGASVNLEFTSLEIDLLREIAFNTGKELDQLVAERLHAGIDVEVPGEDQDYELRYNITGDGELPKIDEEFLGYRQQQDQEDDPYAAEKHDLRFNLNVRLTEFYNIVWTHGASADQEQGLDTDLRKNHVDAYVNLILNKIVSICEHAKR